MPFPVDRKTLDNIFEKGILGLVLAALLFSALATGAVRTLEFAIVETLVAAAGLLWLVRIWVNPKHKRILLPPVIWTIKHRAGLPSAAGIMRRSRSWASTGTSWIWSGSSSLHFSISGKGVNHGPYR